MLRVNGRPLARVLIEESAVVLLVSVATSVIAIAFLAMPDARRLRFSGGGDVIVNGVVPFILASAILFIVLNPALELVAIVSGNSGLLVSRAVLLSLLALIPVIFVSFRAVGGDSSALILRNVSYGYLIGAFATLLSPQRSLVAAVLLPVLFVFFPGDGIWETFASHPLHSFGLVRDALAAALWLTLAIVLYLARIWGDSRWIR